MAKRSFSVSHFAWASSSVEEVHFSEARRAHPCNNAGSPM